MTHVYILQQLNIGQSEQGNIIGIFSSVDKAVSHINRNYPGIVRIKEFPPRFADPDFHIFLQITEVKLDRDSE